MQNFGYFLALTLLCACRAVPNYNCRMPALPEEDVIQIARSYLQSKDIDAEFQANAEYRVKSVGCMYEFELAEEFESFGIGFVVEVDRNGQVIDFYSNE